MERVATLIHKLLEQYQQQADADKLLLTTQMLLTELKQCRQNKENNINTNVAVMMASSSFNTAAAETAGTPAFQQQESYAQPAAEIPAVPTATAIPVIEAPVAEPAAAATITQTPVAEPVQPVMPAIETSVAAVLQSLPPVGNFNTQQEIKETAQPAAAKETAAEPVQQPTPVMSLAAEMPEVKEQEARKYREENIPPKTPARANGSNAWMFDPVHDVPTLSHQATKGYDLNQAMGGGKSESLNERFMLDKNIELVTVLQDSPIQDLKKAIGINDRYQFINELFRGDETMYERSIKTINAFTIYPEANYWIQRELTLKLGWNDRADIVQHFYQLVKRRFS
ncbi:hypothetical protein [Deminuibacter soli]|uniref:Uncharacterized protein n=1 Tax=Deminuibacter soli TaxID=2291815 RepID=A0A3E1NL56_9BACT|nr:hypothetical protein [Deminuibacter soli]RFM28669.1 hypothetical protein DXN05_07705 [Deminuibacter soli]